MITPRVLVSALVLALMLPNSTVAQEAEEDKPPELNSGLVSGLKLRNIGPALMSGRIVEIAVDPVTRSTWYLAVASGGVWKTTNAGVTWEPIFDKHGSYSIGTVAIDPNDHLTVWVGTGENNSQRSVGYGDGVYKSVDGGANFTNVGLKASEHIARILIDPRNSNVVYVAAQGPLWAPGGDRGLYKTTDGGATWQRVLQMVITHADQLSTAHQPRHSLCGVIPTAPPRLDPHQRRAGIGGVQVYRRRGDLEEDQSGAAGR